MPPLVTVLAAVLRDGRWLTRERMRLIALAVLAASTIGLGYLLATSQGLNDFQGRPLGTDFSNVYAAGTLVLEGQPAAPFDPPQHHARQKQMFGDATPFFGWHYPPFFLFLAAVLALMPYVPALVVWQGVTLPLYLFSIHAILSAYLPDKWASGWLWLLLALAYPAVFINLGHGHNGFLTAALIGTALLLLDRHPLLSGMLIGLVAYKPQFGLLIPLVLAATGRWRAFAAAAATVAVLALVTTIAFGPEVWRAFLESTRFTRVVVLEAGDTGWHKIQSVFSWVRMWGGSVPLAYAVQGAVLMALAAALVVLWRSTAAYPLKAAALIIALVLATPYSLDYDLMVLAPAIAFLAADGWKRGFQPYEKTALAFLWFVPLIARTAALGALLPLTVPAALWVFILILRRAAGESDLLPHWNFAPRSKS
jgi:alpha-1,2-mannosyltransferase